MGWRLGRRPALDGLRGVAVLMVVFAHLWTKPFAFASLGTPGVTIFFTLSGFLITSLLWEELRSTGRVSLGAFYRRRARRLGPALVSVVGFVIIVSVMWPRLANWPVTLGALTWSTNWITLHLQGSPAERYTGQATLLGHTWSLAIEEQFYLLWPLILPAIFRWGRRIAIAVTCVGIFASAALPLTFVTAQQHVRTGTDTRAASLLIGALVAMLMHGPPARNRKGFDAPPVASSPRGAAPTILVLIVLAAWCEAAFTQAYKLEGVVVSGLTAFLIWCVVQPGKVRTLEATWLRYVGSRSYALYLWHVPIYWIVALRVSPSPLALATLALPPSFVAAELSWRLVEAPWRTAIPPAADHRRGVMRSDSSVVAAIETRTDLSA
jgi:peptidoglycan/LPS O-acetylase OafA/YrhL